MHNNSFAAIILAAGKGTRMKSDLHKVLHPVGGKPMVNYLLDTVGSLSPERTILVVGASKEQLKALGVVYPCFCTRRDIQAEIEAAERAPHGPDGPIYPRILWSFSLSVQLICGAGMPHLSFLL